MPYNLIMIFCPLFVNLFKKTGILPVFFVVPFGQNPNLFRPKS